MSSPLTLLTALLRCLRTTHIALLGLCRLVFLAARSRSALAAENLFLRKQVALYQERKVKPQRAENATRWLMAALSRLFNWRSALVVVKPDTLMRWHRKGFRLFWRWKSKPPGKTSSTQGPAGADPEDGSGEPSWGQERIANELKLKLAIRVSPRTVEKYLRSAGPARTPDPKQRC